MYVNPFWMGILLTLVGFVIVVIVFSLIASHRKEEEEDGMSMTEEEFRAMVAMAVNQAAVEVLTKMIGGDEESGKKE